MYLSGQATIIVVLRFLPFAWDEPDRRHHCMHHSRCGQSGTGDLAMFANNSDGEMCAIKPRLPMCCLRCVMPTALVQQVSEGINWVFLTSR